MVFNMRWKRISPNRQIDEVGNIVQIHGAVQPKACQKCEKKFDEKPTVVDKKQYVPIYKCTECKFYNAGGDAAFDHKITSDHKITKTVKEMVVGKDKKILGSVARIIKTKNDVIILCGGCFGIYKK